jgi:alpha-tubulin suppressor-like RCC1 family protein
MAERHKVLVAAALLAAVVLAVPPTLAEAAPAAVPEAGSSDWRVVNGGTQRTCGIRTSGRLYCWGRDEFGALGDGGGSADQPAPVQVATGGTNWTAVSVGTSHTCGLRAPGQLWCWGSDYDRQLGDGATNSTTPTPARVGSATDWRQVAAGDAHTCGLRANRRVYCWGSDLGGQLGDGGTAATRAIPRLVAGGFADWTAVTTGAFHTCARRATGRLYCWGYDAEGQLGTTGPNANRTVPTLVSGSITNWVQVTAGGQHTCARRATRQLYCWGSDDNGQLGDDGAFGGQRAAPAAVAGGGTTWTSVTAGGAFTCGRRTTGRLWCWGNDSSGELGDGGTDLDRASPVQVGGGATDWTAVEAGGSATCARITSGRLYCWGSDSHGQLGDGSPLADQGRPVEVFAP